MGRRPTRPPVEVSLHDLTEIEVRLLHRVCRDGPYLSPVALASDEWRGSEDWLIANVDMVQWVLYGLCDQGLVVLRERTAEYNFGITMCYIRATTAGYDLFDYPPTTREIGRGHQRLAAPVDLDATDFRRHGEHAAGTTVERMSLSEHLDLYPSHRLLRSGF